MLPGNRAGDPFIKPERQSEMEAGFDAQLAGGRAEVNFSVYQRIISDLLLERTLPPSSGQETLIFSSDSRLRNRGLEASLTLSPIQSRDVNWLFRTTFFKNKTIITRLSVPTYQTGGFALALGTYQIEQDSSVTQIFGTEGKVGDATPDFQMSFSSDLDYKRFTFGFLLDWKQGGDVINLTEYPVRRGPEQHRFRRPGPGPPRLDQRRVHQCVCAGRILL